MYSIHLRVVTLGDLICIADMLSLLKIFLPSLFLIVLESQAFLNIHSGIKLNLLNVV